MASAPTTAITAELSDTEQRNLRSVTDVLQYWNTRDIPGVLSFYDESITWRNVAMEEIYQGKEAVGAYLAKLFAAFPDLNFEVTHKIARGHNVAEQWFIRGTHRGTFMGIPPTHRRVEIPGMSMVEMRDGKFISDHFYFDSGIVLRQMGLLPRLSVFETLAGRISLWVIVQNLKIVRGLSTAAGASLRLVGLRRASKPTKENQPGGPPAGATPG